MRAGSPPRGTSRPGSRWRGSSGPARTTSSSSPATPPTRPTCSPAALPRDTEVFVFETEHHATLLPWQQARGVQVTTLPVPVEHRARARGPRLRAGRVGRARTGLVVVAGASNVTGELWPLADVVAVAQRHRRPGARRRRAARAAPGHRPRRQRHRLRRLLRPQAVRAVRRRRARRTPRLARRRAPYLRGGGATARVTTDGVAWATGAARHEGGSPNVIGAIAVAAACASISAHREAIEAHEAALAERLRSGPGRHPGRRHLVDLRRRPRPGRRCWRSPSSGFDSSLVSAILSAEHGIGVRDGKFCAHILVDELLEDPWGDTPATAVRVSARPRQHRRARRPAGCRRGRAGRQRSGPALHPDRRGLGRRRRRARPVTPPPLVAPSRRALLSVSARRRVPKPVTTGVWKRGKV